MCWFFLNLNRVIFFWGNDGSFSTGAFCSSIDFISCIGELTIYIRFSYISWYKYLNGVLLIACYVYISNFYLIFIDNYIFLNNS